jgi:hypothetical protein
MTALRLVPAATFAASVKLTVPGERAPAVMTLVFAHKSKRELQAWVKNSADRSDADFLGDVVRGWKVGPVDEHGEPVPYSADALAALLDAYPAAGDEIYHGYMAAYREAKAGN